MSFWGKGIGAHAACNLFVEARSLRNQRAAVSSAVPNVRLDKGKSPHDAIIQPTNLRRRRTAFLDSSQHLSFHPCAPLGLSSVDERRGERGAPKERRRQRPKDTPAQCMHKEKYTHSMQAYTDTHSQIILTPVLSRKCPAVPIRGRNTDGWRINSLFFQCPAQENMLNAC